MITQDIQALRAHFIANFDPGSVPVIYDNQPTVSIPEGSLWMRFSVVPGASFHDAGSAQDGVMIQQGRVWLQVFTPEQRGDGEALALADAFATAFRNKRIDTIMMKTEEFGSRDNRDGYQMISLSIPWESLRRY